jgi:hypothetical protein
MNQLQAVALNEGLGCKKRLWRKHGRQQLESFRLAPWAGRRRRDLLELLDRLNPTIAELSQAIEQEAEKFPEARCLMTHPGVGPLTALAFVLILGKADRFQCGKQVASYLGLVPLEGSSGNRRRLGHITKQGSSMLRFLLVEAAQVTARSIPEWRSKYFHLAMRRGSDFLDLLVLFVNPFAERFDGGQQWLQCRLQFRTQLSCFLGIPIARTAAAQPFPVRLRQSPRRVDQRRPCSHQSGSRSDHHPMSLRLGATMLHRRQQLPIDPRQPGQSPGVEAIIFPPTLPDPAHVACMGHDHFVSQLAQQPAHPGRMHPRFQPDPTPRHFPKHFFHRFRSRAQPLFQQHFSPFIQHAIPARSIA